MTRPDRLPDLPGRLSAWLAEGAHGTMDWMAERADQRARPTSLWPGLRSIVILAMSYRPEDDPLDAPGADRIAARSPPTRSGATITRF